MTAIVGLNGSGKTTLVKVACGIAPAQKGEVRIDGRVLGKDVREREWADFFGVLFQDYADIRMTLREAVTLGSGHETAVPDESIWKALASAHCDSIVRAVDRDLDAQLGAEFQNGHEPSRGQWQRLALARMYLRDAPIWILDEPTSALDAQTEYDVFEQLRAESQKRVVVVVSHRLPSVLMTDYVYVMENGRIAEAGSPLKLIADPHTKLSSLFAAQRVVTGR